MRYSASRTFTMLNSVSIEMIEEWCRINRRSMRDLQMADHAFLIRTISDGVYDLDFIKCRNRQLVFEWCKVQWGDPGPGKGWEDVETTRYNPHRRVRGDENIVLFKMVWE